MTSKHAVYPRREPVETDPASTSLPLDEAGDQINALQTDTARTLLNQLYDEPMTATDLEAGVDTSLQNVHYHLERLLAVELIEVVDTWYSEKGKEMRVYGPSSDPLVIYVKNGDEAVDGQGATAEQLPRL